LPKDVFLQNVIDFPFIIWRKFRSSEFTNLIRLNTKKPFTASSWRQNM